MMPFVRLLGIYAIVILLVVAVFKRDSLIQIAGFAEPEEEVIAIPIGQVHESTPEVPETMMETPVAEEVTAKGEAVSASLSEELEKARQAYWQGNVAEAERLLAALVHEYPNQPDIAGELGNLLFAQTRYDEAAFYYEKAARLLLEQGDKARAGSLVGTLRAISPNAARELQSLLATDQ